MIDFIYNNETSIRLSVFLSSFTLLALWEWQQPKRLLTQNKLKRWFNNIALVVTGTLIVRIVVPMAAVGTAYFAEHHHIGFANHFVLPFWLETAVFFVLLDLSTYFQHLIFHVMPVLWRFHRVHHSDMDYDVSTGLRFHPVELLLSILIKMLLIITWGAPVLTVILFEIVLNFMSMFTHSNISLNEKLEHKLRWFVVTPDMHRIHHSAMENETNSNFSFHISIWDRLFGTYKDAPEAGQLGMTTGLDNFRESTWQNYGSLLMTPFTHTVGGYAINYRDTRNARELAQAKKIALQHKEKAELATELDSYIQAIGQHALITVTDSEGTILEANDKFCEVTGYSLNELLGQNHSIVNSGIHEKSFIKELWSTITNGNSWHGEVCDRAKNGELHWLDSTIVPIKNADKQIERYLSVRVDITHRKKYEHGIENANQLLTDTNIQLEELSQIDALTGIGNRRCFDDALASYISTMNQTDAELTLIICDIDYFKQYNDLYGHHGGDVCLQKIAKSIGLGFTREGDVVARYGGEEFAIILPNVKKETAILLAEQMRANVEALNMEHGASLAADVVTISVGLVTQRVGKHTTITNIIEKADNALYCSKNKGRNRVECFD